SLPIVARNEDGTMKRIRGAITSLVLALSVTIMLAVGVGVATAQTTESSKENQTDIQKRIVAAANVLDEIMGVKEKAIPDKIMNDTECIAVVPSMVKIAIGFSGNHNKDMATCRTANGWNAPAPITITNGSWGLQLNEQAIDLVMLIMNEKGMNALLSSKFKVGADASAAAGPVGRQAAAD